MGIAVRGSDGSSVLIGMSQISDVRLFDVGVEPQNARKFCSEYTFANGTNGHVGLLTEWNLVSSHIEFVNTALIKVGAEEITGSYWTNTLWYDEYYRVIQPTTGTVSNGLGTSNKFKALSFADTPEGLEW